MNAVQTLREAVVAMGSDLREASTFAGRVDKLESEADDIFAELYHQLKAIIERLESMADRCSRNAELIRRLALESIEDE